MKRKERHDLILAASKNYLRCSQKIESALADEISLKRLEKLRAHVLTQQIKNDAHIEQNRHRTDLLDALRASGEQKSKLQQSLIKLDSRISTLKTRKAHTEAVITPSQSSSSSPDASLPSSCSERSLSNITPKGKTLDSQESLMTRDEMPPQPLAVIVDNHVAPIITRPREQQTDRYAIARGKLAAIIKGDKSDLDNHIRELIQFADKRSIDDSVLIDVFDNTRAMLNGEVDIPSYIRYANTSTMPGVPSIEQKLLGALMLALSAVAALLVVLAIPAAIALPTIASATLPAIETAVSATLCFAGLRFFNPPGLARSMNQLTHDYTTKKINTAEERLDTVAISPVL